MKHGEKDFGLSTLGQNPLQLTFERDIGNIVLNGIDHFLNTFAARKVQMQADCSLIP